MGTQFSSRLRSVKQRERIRESIQSSLSSVVGTTDRKVTAASDIELLSSAEQLKVGRLTVGGILNVAGESDFFELFAQSQIFEEVLKWLRELWIDASTNGFQDSIEEYKLEEATATTPSARLSSALRELTRSNKSADRFRVAATTAGMGILAQTATRQASSKPGDSKAKIYGRKLASFSLEELITKYIENFLTELISKIINMVTDNPAEKMIQNAIKVSGKTAKQIAKAVVNRIKQENKLGDIKYIHQAVIDELRKLAAAVPIKSVSSGSGRGPTP